MTLDETLFRGRVIKVRWKCNAMAYGYALRGNVHTTAECGQNYFWKTA